MKPLRWRIIFVAGVSLLSMYLLASTFVFLRQPADLRNDLDHMAKVMPKWATKSHLNLGLDLQGGVQLVLGVDLDQALENRLGRLATELQRWAEDEKLPVKSSYVVKGQQRLRVELNDGADLETFRTKFRDNVSFSNLESSDRNGLVLDYTFKADQVKSTKLSALDQVERVVRSRVDKWGVTEPIINRRADNTILAQLPGFKDPEKAKELLGRTAQLEFKIVDDEFRGLDEFRGKLPAGVTEEAGVGTMVLVSEDKAAIENLVKGKIPADRELLFQKEALAGGKKFKYRSYIVKAQTEINGDDVLDATVTRDGSGLDPTPAVQIKFTGAGGKRFSDVTGANVNKRMAIILDSIVESAPVIKTKISGGSAVITLGGGQGWNQQVEEATQLSLVLKSGALPASIQILEQRQVGASLGPELARQGIMGVIIGVGFVSLFMLLYYRRPGFIACLALALNAIFLLALMASFGFALTLPGIAGFVLSLGMAVDANVLINERIRQELREGKHPKKALENGFGRVFWTVMDSHVTCLLTGFILLGTNTSGPIRGFAVTLIIGLLVSLFTALYCSHLFFDIALHNKSDERSIRAWLGGTNATKARNFGINFLKYDMMNTTIAAIFSLLVLGGALSKGFNWSVDFVGGTEMEVMFAEPVPTDRIRDVASAAGIKDISVQALEGNDRQFLLRFDDHAAAAATEENASKPASMTVQTLQTKIGEDLASFKPSVARVDYVGPQIGKELRNQGFVSMFYAIIGILVYLALRFDMRFGTGAVIKLIPDTCFMLGFYLVFWRSFDLTSVAALLTGIGYSVNDVIVVYDRIRENIALHPRRTLRENINISLNETLARTINVSLATNLSLVGILIFGSGPIWNFAAAMSVGIVGGTITSNFVGSSYLLWIDKVLNRRGKGTRATPATAAR